MVFEMTTIIKLNHVASHHLHHHYQRNVVFGRKIYNHHAIIYYLFIVCKKSMVTEKECVDEKLQSENGAEIQGEKKWWRER